MSVIRWEDPPPYGDGRVKKNRPRRTEFWREIAEELRANPGQWAVVLQGDEWNYVGGIAGQIKNGGLIAFRPAGSFDAIMRTTGDFRLYARYVGGES